MDRTVEQILTNGTVQCKQFGDRNRELHAPYQFLDIVTTDFLPNFLDSTILQLFSCYLKVVLLHIPRYGHCTYPFHLFEHEIGIHGGCIQA